jgi:glutathione S-transferase
MNPEDTPLSDGSKVDFANQAVERVRRAHQNDLENIVPFFVLAPLYLTTGPQAPLANNLFRVFTAARILHTIVYLNKVEIPYLTQLAAA